MRVGKIRRGGYIFITWAGDHPPRHVHVYREGRFIVRWDLENEMPMKGRASRRLIDIIQELQRESLL